MTARGRTSLPSSSERWLQLAVQDLARRDRSVAQVEQLLRNKGASPVQAKRAIERLTELRYLDDRAYAERWIEKRLIHRPMGRERMKAELQAKGIAEAVADGAIRELLRGIDEDTLARRALTVSRRMGRKLTPMQSTGLLHRWGFGEETINRILGARTTDEECEA